MREALRKHRISFEHAFSGLLWALRTQPNFKIHGLLSAMALFGAYWYNVSATELLVIVFTIVLGFSSEMINTSIESMTDLITKEWRQEARVAKDVAAGMMLTVAIGSLIVAAIIFIPYIF